MSATPLPGSDAVAAALVYDPLGRLFQVASPVTGTRRFLYDGDALVAEYNGANLIAARHVHWPGADLPMVTYEGEGLATIRQLLADHQGSIVALADASGAAVQINRYDEYGIPGAGNDGTFQYTGQMWLPELGMYHYKARIYSPTLGRFLQTDPIGYEDQFNLYAYVGNDPVNLNDPTGLCGRICDLAEDRRSAAMREIRKILDDYAAGGTFLEDPEAAPTTDQRSAAAQWARLWRPVLERLGSNEELVGGVVTRNSDGKFSIVVPFLIRQGGSMDINPFRVRVRMQDGLQFRSDIHSHQNSAGFSPDDMGNIARTGRGSFLVDTHSRNGSLWYMAGGPRGNRGEYRGAVPVCTNMNICPY